MLAVVNSTNLAWSGFNFNDFQNQITDMVSDITASQEQARLSRKNLVSNFIQFRDSASEDVKKAAAPLLKDFQSEIDNLTSRCHRAEVAIIHVYKRLSDMPDPSLALLETENLNKQAQKAIDLMTENVKLREAVDELKLELIAHKSNEVLFRDLQARFAEIEESNLRNVEVHRRKLEEQFETKENELALLCREADTRTSVAEAKVHSLTEALHTAQAEVFALQSRLEVVNVGRSKELEILVDDLEKANERITILTGDQQVLHSVKTGDSNTNKISQLLSRIEDLESELETKDQEVSNLSEQMRLVGEEQKNEIANLRTKLEGAEATLHAAKMTIASIEADLMSKSDYDIMKRELQALLSIEFQQPSSDPYVDFDEPLEFQLRRKNEQLRNKIASLGAAKDQIEAELNVLREDMSALLERETQQKMLIARLEEDLNSACTWRQNRNFERVGSSTLPDGKRDAAETEEASLDELLSISQETPKQVDFSILSVVQNQRDRLRERNQRLEEDIFALRQEVSVMQTTAESMRMDNVKLYEKLQFVQSYPSVASNRDNSTRLIPSHKSHENNLDRYSEAYEAQLNPFEQFHQQERHRRYQSLLPHEKILHGLGRLIINDRRARLFTFAYALALHLLVFLVLYKMVHSTLPLCPRSTDNGPLL